LPTTFLALALTAGAAFLVTVFALVVALRFVADGLLLLSLLLPLALVFLASLGLADAAALAARNGFEGLGDDFFGAALAVFFVPCFSLALALALALALELVFFVGFLALAITGLPGSVNIDTCSPDHSVRIN